MKPKLIAALAIIACPTLALAQVSAGAGGTDGGAGGAKTGTTGPGIGTSDSGKSANGSAVRTDSNGAAAPTATNGPERVPAVARGIRLRRKAKNGCPWRPSLATLRENYLFSIPLGAWLVSFLLLVIGNRTHPSRPRPCPSGSRPSRLAF